MPPTLSDTAIKGLALAFEADQDLADWAASHERLYSDVALQLDRYRLTLTPEEFSSQVTRRLYAARAVEQRKGESGVRLALGLDDHPVG